MKNFSSRFFATILLAMSLLISCQVLFAEQYCGETITSTDGKGKTAVLTCTNPSANTYVMTITSDDADFTGLRGDNMYCHINGNGTTYHMTDTYTWDSGTKTVTFTITSTAVPDMYTPLYLNMNDEIVFANIQNKTFEWPESCGGGGGSSSLVLSEGSQYCNYYGNGTKTGSAYATLSWETTEDGDVVITIGDGPGMTGARFRNGGFEGSLDEGFSVLSGENFATSEVASTYFNRIAPSGDNKTYTLQKKADLPSPARIKFTTKAFAWKCDQNAGAYTFPTFEYDYATTCGHLDAPTNVSVSSDSVVTFNTVSGAANYIARVYKGSALKYSQTVASGDVLHFFPLVDADYKVKVVAHGYDILDSEESSAYTWSLLHRDLNLGNSEYCEHVMSSGNTEAAFTWETTDEGAIVITISETLGGAANASHFRGNGMAIGNFKVGESKANASDYFNHACGGTNQVTLTLKDEDVAPDPGEKIYFNQTVEYATSKDGNAWPTLSFEYTYGTVCSGKAVSAAVNNGDMGTATVKAAGEEVTSVESGTQVTFTATSKDAELYRFVNWTKSGVEVSTNATYTTTITETTNLVANFEYIRNAYCHTTVTSAQGKKFYLTLAPSGNSGDYVIRYDGSAEAKITAINNANFQINGVSTDWDDDGVDVPFSKDNGAWTFDNTGYGSAQITFGLAAGKTWEDIFAWNHNIYFACEGLGEQNLSAVFPSRHHIAWNETCADEAAPVMAVPTGMALNTTDVRISMSATDNWEGLITYNINYKPTGDNGVGTNVQITGASGATVTKDITGLTTNTEYTFSVTASDGTNVCAAQSCTVTPSGDIAAPTGLTVSAMALTDKIIRLTLFANDDFAGDITYNISYDNQGSAVTSAARGESTTYDITGLTAGTEYHFSVTATDAADNTSSAVNASETTFAGNLALNQPATAGHNSENAGQSNDGNINSRWGSNGATHYNNGANPDFGDWWYVDLGAVYDIASMMVYWETARPSDYDIRVSYDAVTWTNAATYNTLPVASQSEGQAYYGFTSNQGRYIGVWARNGYNNMGYGISPWEIEAYGTLATDAVAPVISAFTATAASSSSVLLRATADDNFKGNLTYTFYCNDVAQANPVMKAAGQEADYTVNGLTMGTNYNFKVVVSDGVNSTTSNVVVGSPIGDSQAPANVSVSTKSALYNAIVLTLTATDDMEGMIFYTVTCGSTVKNAQALSGADVDVTFDGLNYTTTYNFSVVAKDGSDNAAAAVAHSATTPLPPFPLTTAPDPTLHHSLVLPVYSDAYASILKHDFVKHNWGSVNEQMEEVDGNNFMLYDMTGGDAVVWGSNNAGADAIVAQDAYTNGQGDDNTGVDASAMTHLHMDIWSQVAMSNIAVRINDQIVRRISLTNEGWQSFDIALADPVEAINTSNVRWFKITNINDANRKYLAFDNIYFYTASVPALELNDHTENNTSIISANDDKCMDVTLVRDFTAGTLYTLCLPFSMPAAQLAEVFGAGYELHKLMSSERKANDDILLNFVKVADMTAGTPYLFRPAQSMSSPLLESVVIDAGASTTVTTDLFEMIGYYDRYQATEDDLFLGSDTYLHKSSARSYGFRARFRFVVPNMQGVRARAVLQSANATDVATEIDLLEDADVVLTQKIIRDGQLYIIRDGVIYNAQGQRVE